MKKFLVALLALTSALVITPAAKANTYDLSFAGTGTGIFGSFNGTGILVTTVGGVVTSVTGGSFTFTGGGGGTVTASLDSSPVHYFNIGDFTTPTTDNKVVSGPNLDSNGLALSLSNGYTIVLADDGPGVGYVFEYFLGAHADEGIASASVTLTKTPEPGSLFLLGTGMLGLAVVLFRKVKPSTGFALKM